MGVVVGKGLDVLQQFREGVGCSQGEVVGGLVVCWQSLGTWEWCVGLGYRRVEDIGCSVGDDAIEDEVPHVLVKVGVIKGMGEKVSWGGVV